MRFFSWIAAYALAFGVAALASAQPDCERPTGRRAQGCLAAPLHIIDSATHELLRFRLTEIPDGRVQAGKLFGLADENGRQILPPTYIEIHPINRNWAYGTGPARGRLLVNLQTGEETEWTWGFNEFDFGGARIVFAGGAGAGSGVMARSELHLLGLDAQPAKSFPSVRWISRFGPFLIFNHVDEARADVSPREIGISQWLDQSGQTVRTTPEIAVINYRGQQVAMIPVSAHPPLRTSLSNAASFTYRLIDPRGQDVPLPNNVVGFAPIDDPAQLTEPYPPFVGWVVVREIDGRRQVSITHGSIEDAMNGAGRTMVVEDGMILVETERSYLFQNEPPRRHTVMRQAGGPWYLYANWGLPREQTFGSAQDAANFFSSSYNRQAEVWAAENQARREAALAAERARREAGEAAFVRGMALHAPGHLEHECPLLGAALQAGGERVVQLISLHPRVVADPAFVEGACRSDAIACDAALTAQNAFRAEEYAIGRRRLNEQIARAARFREMANPDPEVRVNIYENGQFRTEVMPRSHYENLYR